MDMKNLRLTEFVVQLLKAEQEISEHKDKITSKNYCTHRKIAFIYYLTPDEWWYRIDGGELCCRNDNDNFTSFEPTFNSMVVFDMTDNDGPLHWVRSASKDRIALVGFFS
jgi:Rps23 Pro-64 3,4-dihydroxylase Tpa1-like proline 4-hydroxylase